MKAKGRIKESRWVFTIDVTLPNGEVEHIGDGDVPLDSHGKPTRGPDFYIDKRITYEGEPARIDLIKDGKNVPLTEFAITEASSEFKKEFGHEPTELPGSIADDNRSIFQRAYLAAIDKGKPPAEAAEAAARNTPFVKNRVRLGFTDVRVVPTAQMDKIVYGNPPRVREAPHGAEIVARKP